MTVICILVIAGTVIDIAKRHYALQENTLPADIANELIMAGGNDVKDLAHPVDNGYKIVSQESDHDQEIEVWNMRRREQISSHSKDERTKFDSEVPSENHHIFQRNYKAYFFL